MQWKYWASVEVSKTWLKYLADKNQKTEKELLRMMFEYQKFLKVSQQADSQIRVSLNKK